MTLRLMIQTLDGCKGVLTGRFKSVKKHNEGFLTGRFKSVKKHNEGFLTGRFKVLLTTIPSFGQEDCKGEPGT
jgi:hypothetical protein